jgi:hypothetical protein
VNDEIKFAIVILVGIAIVCATVVAYSVLVPPTPIQCRCNK